MPCQRQGRILGDLGFMLIDQTILASACCQHFLAALMRVLLFASAVLVMRENR